MTLEELKAKRAEHMAESERLQGQVADCLREGEKEIRRLRDEFADAQLNVTMLDRQIAAMKAPPVDRSKQCSTSGEDPAAVRAAQAEDPETGQHKSYVVLCKDERAKGFVRPVRSTYVHVGPGGHEIDPNDRSKHGRTGSGCGVATSMGTMLAETYARDPKFYTSTFCVGCNKHLPVNEFVWNDGERLGS